VGGTPTPIGSGDPSSDMDMNYYIPWRSSADATFQSLPMTYPGPPYASQPANKFCEESWIDQNGTAFLVNPANGSLIKGK
jgi:hypothetical protein